MAKLTDPTRILVVGGGYVGMYTALRLQKKLSRKAEITVVDPQSNMTYQPFLPEAAAGSLEPRHVVVPLRKILRRCRVITATVTRIEHARKAATVLPSEGEGYEIGYDLLVVCPGSVSRLLPIPGLAEHGIGFKTIGEAIYLRNHVLSRLDLAASVTDPERRRRALSFVFVGGGYAGVEAIAELQDMARYALRYVDSIDAIRHAVDARRGGDPDHARGIRRSRGLYGRPARRAQHRRAAIHPFGVRGRRACRAQ